MSFLKQSILLMILLSGLYSPHSLKSQNSQEEFQAISELKKELKELLTYAPYIDSDTESYWAYKRAESLLNSVDSESFDLYQATATIYNAYSHIFYGMSYTKTVYYSSERVRNGLDSTFSELSSVLCKNELNQKPHFVDCELRANFSMVYFYKVSNMDAYSRLYELYQTESININEINKKYDSERAYKVNSIRLKKLNFKVLVSFIVDLYFVNNPKNESVSQEFGRQLNALGVKMDTISSNEQNILKWSNTDFNENLLTEINVISKLISLLNNELKLLTSS